MVGRYIGTIFLQNEVQEYRVQQQQFRERGWVGSYVSDIPGRLGDRRTLANQCEYLAHGLLRIYYGSLATDKKEEFKSLRLCARFAGR